MPTAVIAIARQHLPDALGCCLAAKDLDTSRALAALLMSEGGAEQATAIGVVRRLPASQTAFLNGLLVRSLEYDDMAMHAGIDAALALSRSGLKPEQVQSAELAVATPILRTIGEPLARKQAQRSA
jgi:hypothetical protein